MAKERHTPHPEPSRFEETSPIEVQARLAPSRAVLSRRLDRLLRSSVGLDEQLLERVPEERRRLNALGVVLLLSALVGASALSVGLGETGVGMSIQVALVTILLVTQLVTDRIVASAVLVIDRTRRWRVAVGVLTNLVTSVPASLLISDLLLLRIFAQEAGSGGLLAQLERVNTLLADSATGTMILWAVRALVFGLLVLPVIAILATPLPVYPRLNELQQRMKLDLETQRLNVQRRIAEEESRVAVRHQLEEERRWMSRSSQGERERQALDRQRAVDEEAKLRAAVDRLAAELLRKGES